jgi:immune inhibitor A
LVGKKLLGLITAVALLFNTAGVTNVNQSRPQNNKDVSYKQGAKKLGATDLAMANEDKIVEMLKKEGKIPKNATPEQIEKIYKDYVKAGTDPDNIGKMNVSAEQKKQDTVNNQKVHEFLSKTNNSKTLKASSSSEVNSVEKQTWNGTKRTDKLLVIRIDFQDLKHNTLTAEDQPVLAYKDYSDQHYKDMLFGANGYTGPNGETLISMKQFYEAQSGGSYSVDGVTTPWYTAKGNAADYGKEVKGADGSTIHDIAPDALIKEALDAVAKDPNIDLSQFDLLDRSTGEAKADGILDHVVVIHAGTGQEGGGGRIGSAAIWSHRSSLGGNYKLTDTKGKVYYANDYTTEPEDGGAGVFCHEFGHDIGLPDEYDTIYSGNGEPIGYWSLMSSGSWGGKIAGSEPVGFSPYAKQYFQATMGGNWQSKVSTVNVNDVNTKGLDFILDEASSKGANNNVVRVNLPQKQTTIVTPTSGKYAYYSGKIKKSLANTFMTTSVDLSGKAKAALTCKLWYDLEDGYDYGSVQVREKGATDWTVIPSSFTTTENVAGSHAFVSNGFTGSSDGKWIDANFDLSAFAGKQVEVKFQYNVDEGSFLTGFYVDDVKITADDAVVLSDDVEGTPKFTVDNGFTVDTGIVSTDQYYLLEWRSNNGTDAPLANVNRAGAFLAYDPGLLVWYADEYYDDNWTGIHPGEGFLGLVDADQTPVKWTYNDGKQAIASNSFQIHDAAFSLKKSAPFMLDQTKTSSARYMQDNDTFMHPFFSDDRNYLNPSAPFVGRNVPKMGMKIYVTGAAKDNSAASIRIKK